MLNEGQNQSEQSLLTTKPMAPTTLDSISHNTSLILMNKKQLLTAPGGTLNSRYPTDKPSAGLWISAQDCTVCSHIQETKPKSQAAYHRQRSLTTTLET